MASPTKSLDVVAALDRLGLWPLRVLWLIAPLALGHGLGPELDRFDHPGPVVAEGWLWAGWFVGLVATLAPSAISLTVIRVLAPATIAVGLVTGVAAGSWTGRLLTALAYGILVTAVCYLPVVGDRMVNGSAYGSERRMTLRPPAFTLLGPVELAWLVVVAGLITGPFLLAAGRYVLGGLAVIVGAAAAWLGGRVLHQLARRWIVFVPAGFVIHDHVIPVESILLRRTIVSTLGPATTPIPSDAVDLSGGATGLALQVVLDEPVTFGRRVGGEVVSTETDRIVFSPTLPGAVLTEARLRAIRIDVP